MCPTGAYFYQEGGPNIVVRRVLLKGMPYFTEIWGYVAGKYIYKSFFAEPIVCLGGNILIMTGFLF